MVTLRLSGPVSYYKYVYNLPLLIFDRTWVLALQTLPLRCCTGLPESILAACSRPRIIKLSG